MLNIFKDVYYKLSMLKGINLSEIKLNDPIQNGELVNIESNLSFKFPESLKELFLYESSCVNFIWSSDTDIFRDDCIGGGINLISPQKIEFMYNDMLCIVDEYKLDTEAEGAIALVKDWPNWIPIIVFQNGDAFCIDKSKCDNPIVFLEHDVMDGGPNLHGLKLATNFDDLIDKWSKIYFADIYDWTLVTNKYGIDLSSERLKNIIQH